MNLIIKFKRVKKLNDEAQGTKFSEEVMDFFEQLVREIEHLKGACRHVQE